MFENYAIVIAEASDYSPSQACSSLFCLFFVVSLLSSLFKPVRALFLRTRVCILSDRPHSLNNCDIFQMPLGYPSNNSSFVSYVIHFYFSYVNMNGHLMLVFGRIGKSNC